MTRRRSRNRCRPVIISSGAGPCLDESSRRAKLAEFFQASGNQFWLANPNTAPGPSQAAGDGKVDPAAVGRGSGNDAPAATGSVKLVEKRWRNTQTVRQGVAGRSDSGG